MKKYLLTLVMFSLLLTGCSSSEKDKRFEVEKELYLMCVDRVVENQRNNPQNDLGTMEHFNQARIYCVDLYPNALK
jgi:major membrane immunogen (membrane-anchored lipoprotein)